MLEISFRQKALLAFVPRPKLQPLLPGGYAEMTFPLTTNKPFHVGKRKLVLANDSTAMVAAELKIWLGWVMSPKPRWQLSLSC